jgi:hypothetical protein
MKILLLAMRALAVVSVAPTAQANCHSDLCSGVYETLDGVPICVGGVGQCDESQAHVHSVAGAAAPGSVAGMAGAFGLIGLASLMAGLRLRLT